LERQEIGSSSSSCCFLWNSDSIIRFPIQWDKFTVRKFQS
jgi:hypothetical protein